MSHAMGLMKFPDREGYLLGEYNGTADFMMPKFYTTSEEAQANWRTDEWPECPHNPSTWVDVEVFSHYGCGSWWAAKACSVCNIQTTNLSPYELEEEGGVVHERCPDWCPDWCEHEEWCK